MKLLPNHQLSKEQLAAHQMVEMILNTTDFEAWFVRTRFTELNFERKNLPTVIILEQNFRNQQHRFIWKIVKRPLWKLFSKEPGFTDGFTIHTYRQVFDKMTLAERAGHLAHEIMHVMGFEHSKKPSLSRNRSIPYQVADYVQKAVAHYAKANE